MDSSKVACSAHAASAKDFHSRLPQLSATLSPAVLRQLQSVWDDAPEGRCSRESGKGKGKIVI